MSELLDPGGVMPRRRAVDSQDFMAVILVGPGDNLYPLNEGPNVISKTLLPVGNVPIINYVLDWVLDSGLTDILLVVPPTFHSAIADHLTENYSSSSHPRARIDLKKYTDGDRDDDDLQSESTKSAEGPKRSSVRRDGTARLLRRFKSYITSDFVLLPCDIYPPSYLPLASVLDKHRASPSAVLTSVLYEPAEAVRESEEKILVALDKSTRELLLIHAVEALEDELPLRTSLMQTHPSLTLTTRYLDAHVYVFRRTFLDLLSTRRPRDLDSIKEQIVPWLIKGGWQRKLQERWDPILNPPRRNIFAAALARSATRPSGPADIYSTPESSPSSTERRNLHLPSPSPGPSSRNPSAPSTRPPSTTRPSRLPGKRGSAWKCQYIIAAPPKPVENIAPPTGKSGKDKGVRPPAAEPDYLIRINSLAGYWELNRRLLRYLSSTISTAPASRPAPTRTDSAMSAQTDIAASAQISGDSVVGEGTKVGERASIKKCVVGRHCHIGRGVKLTGCVIWDFVTIEENARLENAILCSQVRIGEKVTVRDCEFGPGFEAASGATLKGERLIAGQEV